MPQKRPRSYKVHPMAANKRDRVVFRRARLTDSSELLRLLRAYYRFDGIRFATRTVGAGLKNCCEAASSAESG
jgi:hypothetical protein